MRIASLFPDPSTSRGRPTALILAAVLAGTVILGAACARGDSGAEFVMRLPALDRVWIGPDYYGNRLQDWRLADDRVEAVTGASTRSMRTLQLLTYAMSEEPGRIEMSVRTGPVEPGGTAHENTWTGFLIGAGDRARQLDDRQPQDGAWQRQ